MKVVLLRVGIDTGSGGCLGPLFADGSFEFVPIPDHWGPNRLGVDSRTYGNYVGRHGRPLVEYLPNGMQARMSRQPMHVDPEFETFTYGDPTTPKAGLRHLTRGDLLVFYAGLKGYDCAQPRGLYIVGFFEVVLAGRTADLGNGTVKGLFGANFHVRHQEVFQDQRDHLVLVKGSSASKLLTRAVLISDIGQDKSGRPVYVLSKEMRTHFGTFTELSAIQRSTPRWVASQFAEHAAEFVQSLP